MHEHYVGGDDIAVTAIVRKRRADGFAARGYNGYLYNGEPFAKGAKVYFVPSGDKQLDAEILERVKAVHPTVETYAAKTKPADTKKPE